MLPCDLDVLGAQKGTRNRVNAYKTLCFLGILGPVGVKSEHEDLAGGQESRNPMESCHSGEPFFLDQSIFFYTGGKTRLN